MRRITTLLGAIFLLGAGTVAYSFYSADRHRKRHQAEMLSLLRAIDRAEAETRYAGVRTTSYEWAGTEYRTTLRITRDGDRRKFEVVATDSKGGQPVKTSWLGGLPSSLKPGYGVRGRFHDPELVLENYDVRVLGRREIAGRSGDVVQILSRHPGRPSYLVVADAETRFPLAFEVRNDAGARILDTRFEEIRFPASFPEGTFPEKKRRGLPSWIRVTEGPVALETARTGFPVWLPQELPAGFRLVEARTIRIETTQPILFDKKIDIEVLHAAYTDGLALFTIVEISRDNEVWQHIRGWLPEVKSANGVVARKFTCATGVALLLELEKTVVLLAGNVSSGELEASARSLVRR